MGGKNDEEEKLAYNISRPRKKEHLEAAGKRVMPVSRKHKGNYCGGEGTRRGRQEDSGGVQPRKSNTNRYKTS